MEKPKTILLKTFLIWTMIGMSYSKLNPSNWMSHEKVRSKTLSELTLLGSHDSASITINGKTLNGIK
jgi:hypothetical protein